MQDLTITLIQTALHWEDAEANFKNFSEKIEAIDGDTDLIILPEMFTTGFTMNPSDLAEPTNGNTFQWMQSIAAKYSSAVLGSVVITEDGNYLNRLLVVFPDGSSHKYDKKHLFGYAGEDKSFTAGTDRLIFEWKGWKICPLVCYDLRFPAWARNHFNSDTKQADYDLLLYVANWPKPRINAWDALLAARAIENQTYVAGVNRIGLDGNKNEYIGHSTVYDYMGNSIGGLIESDGVLSVKLSVENQIAFRKKLPFLEDGDSFSFEC